MLFRLAGFFPRFAELPSGRLRRMPNQLVKSRPPEDKTAVVDARLNGDRESTDQAAETRAEQPDSSTIKVRLSGDPVAGAAQIQNRLPHRMYGEVEIHRKHSNPYPL